MLKARSSPFHKLDLVYMKMYTGRMASEHGTKFDSFSADSSAGSTNASHAIMTRYGEEVQDVAY